jgi:hypothetical protein
MNEEMETPNWIDSGMLITETFCCFSSTKNLRVRGVEDILTSIITTLPFLLHDEFPSLYFPFHKTDP